MIFVVNLLLLAQKSSCNIGGKGDEVGFNNNNNNARKHVTSGVSKNNSGDRYINHVSNKKNEQNIEKNENRGSSGAKDYLMRDHQRNGHQPM